MQILELFLYQRYLPAIGLQRSMQMDTSHLVDIQCKFLVEDLDTYSSAIIECYSLNYIMKLFSFSSEIVDTIYSLAFSLKHTTSKAEINLLDQLSPIHFKKELTWSLPVDIEVGGDDDRSGRVVGGILSIGTKQSLLDSKHLKMVEIDSMQLYTMNYKEPIFKLIGEPILLQDKDEIYRLLLLLKKE